MLINLSLHTWSGQSHSFHYFITTCTSVISKVLRQYTFLTASRQCPLSICLKYFKLILFKTKRIVFHFMPYPTPPSAIFLAASLALPFIQLIKLETTRCSWLLFLAPNPHLTKHQFPSIQPQRGSHFPLPFHSHIFPA